jgi:AsmA-like protein
MKWIKRIVLAVVLLIVIAVGIVFFSIDRVIKSQVQTQATSQLNLKTDLGSAALSLFGGKLGLHELQIASPQGYTAPHMLEVGDTNVAVSYGQLRNQPVHVNSIRIDKPKLVIEQKDGVFNFKKAMEGMPKGEPAPAKDEKSQPLKLIIDDLTVTNADVVVRPNLPGLSNDITVTVPSLTMKNIGSGEGNTNGAAVKDVVMQLISALAANATESGRLPDQLKNILKTDVNQVVSNFGAEAQKRIASVVPGDLGQTLSAAVKDPNALVKDPGKALQGLVDGKKDSSGNATSQPANLQNEATDALKGLLGGKKK